MVQWIYSGLLVLAAIPTKQKERKLIIRSKPTAKFNGRNLEFELEKLRFENISLKVRPVARV